MSGSKNLYLKDNVSFEKKTDILNKYFGCNYKAYQKAVLVLNDEYCIWMPRMAKDDNTPHTKKDKWINVYKDDYIIEKRTDDSCVEHEYKGLNRIVFIKDNKTEKYSYVGVFAMDEQKSTNKENYYKRIKKDIAVDEWNVIEKILFCNVAYMKEYNGITEHDYPMNGGEYVRLHHDALEKWNFSNGSNVKGFVETKYKDGFESGKEPKEIHIERLDRFANEKESVENVKVVFVAKKNGVKEKVVVGWYDNATVYRNRHYYERKGQKIEFNIETKKKDAHLVDEGVREYLNVPLARTSEFGMGQSNVWYAGEKKIEREFSHKLFQKIEYYTSLGVEDIEDEKYVLEVNEYSKSTTPKLTFEGDVPKAKKEAVKVSGGKKYPHNAKIAWNALDLADHKCEYDESHKTFKRKSRDEYYTEPHHLIPISQYKKFDQDIDVEANIVSLCCNCHRRIHLGKDSKEMVKELYLQRKDRLKNVGIDISLEELLEMYF